ncbi:MAG: DUF4870 family protein [Gammaproteobacteria bacterium]
MNELTTQDKPASEGTAKAVYILYLVSTIFGITGVIGVIMAYINQSDAPERLRTHYQFQIRTFWIGALYMLTGLLLTVVLIGYVVLLFWLIWLIVRCVKGLKLLDQKAAHPNPRGWMF